MKSTAIGFSGSRLKVARKMKGYSLQKLAETLADNGLSLTKQALHKYESGNVAPKWETVRKLADVLAVTTSFFTETRQEHVEFDEIRWFKNNHRPR